MATSLTPAGSVGARAVAPNLSLRDLMFCFEGFGDNCEFGFIQRRLGAEPLGLFRFAWLGLPEIVEALQTGFAALDTPENVEVYLHENDEYFVRFNTSSYYHTFIFSGQEEQEAVRRKQLIRISLLRRNLIETLEQGTKIIVRKGQGPATLQELKPLHAALRAFGPNTLLWVVPCEPGHPPGSVEVLEDRLMRGYVSRIGVLAPFVDSTLDDWAEVCINAYRLWRGTEPPTAPVAPNLLATGGMNAAEASRGLNGASLESGGGVPDLGDEKQILRHRLSRAVEHLPVAACDVRCDLEPGEFYVVSAWLWIPVGFTGRAIGPMFVGLSTIAAQQASLALLGQWQLIWAAARIPENATRASVGLNVAGGGDDELFTTRWRLEEGEYPSEYLPRSDRPPAPSDVEIACRNLIPTSKAPDDIDWHAKPGILTSSCGDVPAFQAGEVVLRHEADALVDGIAFDRLLRDGIAAGKPHTLSMQVWIPSTFRGEQLVPLCVGFATTAARQADLALRDCWQRIWATTVVPRGQDACAPALRVRARPGDVFFSTCWKLEQGEAPSRYVPQRRNLIAGACRFSGPGWIGGTSARADLDPSPSPPIHEAGVLMHRLLQRTSGGNMVVHRLRMSIDAAEDRDFVLSIWVKIQAGFRGLMVCPQIDDLPPRALSPASMTETVRSQWQLVWTQARVPAGLSELDLRLLVIGEMGDNLQSACWKLERGHTPSISTGCWGAAGHPCRLPDPELPKRVIGQCH